MNNKTIRKKIKVLSICILLLSVSFLIGGIILNGMLKNAGEESVKHKLINETKLYESQIMRQIDTNLQTLNTLTYFIDFEDKQCVKNLLDRLSESNQNNHFIRISIFYDSGMVCHATLNQGITETTSDSLDEKLQESIQNSWQGKQSVSKVYYDQELKKKVIVISVPVYEGETIIGVLAGYESMDDFDKILGETYNEEIHTHLISSNGTFLVRTGNPLVEEDRTSIFEVEDIVLNERKIREALENQQELYDTIKKDGKTYAVYFKPLERNDWVLVNMIPSENSEDRIVKQVQSTSFVYGVIIFIYVVLLISFFRGIRKNDELLEKQAYYDPLTGAMKLERFRQKVGEQLQKGTRGSMVMLNVKNFQFINETFGEDCADDLLKDIVKSIKEELVEHEFYSRDTADQFLMFILDEDETKIRKRIAHIRKNIEKHFSRNKFDYDIQLSVGVCTKQQDPSKMYYNCLWAMKRARNANEKIVFFDDGLMKSIQIQNEIESSMHQALKNGEFQLFLQPKYDILQNKIIGSEALVRWIRHDGSMYFPDQFIPLFEKNGFCVDLDLYMLETVCKKLREWMDAGKEVYPISVNQTKLLFYHTDYIDNLKAILNKYNISPKLIILEVLEGLAVDDLESFSRCIERLHDNGFVISLDDFGSGYSSLSTLNELKVDEIKIDRKFIMKLKEDDDSQQNNIFHKIISLVGTLDSQVVVEGVETKEHVSILKSMNCRFAQGYYFSKPISCSEFEEKFINVS